MLTTADFAGITLQRIRALTNLQLDDGRRLHAGESADVTPEEAQRHVQRAAATFEASPERKPASCSARRDHLWKAGIP